MSLSCSRIIKSENVNLKGKKVIRNFVNTLQNEGNNNEISIRLDEEILKREEEIRAKLEEAESKYQEIIKFARIESEKLINESKDEVVKIEKKAYEQGYSQGIKNGYEDGYKEAYEDNIEKAKKEANQIIENANNVLFEAKKEAVNYMIDNKANILSISVSIAEQILREKFEDKYSMDKLLVKIIEEYDIKEGFIIKVNPLYKESLETQILNLKKNHKVNTDIFVLADESIKKGNVTIDNSRGRLVVGIDSVLDKIKGELL